MLTFFGTFFELFSLLSCIYAYKKLDNNFKIFLPFLTFVVVYELINIFFMRLVLWHHTNLWCHNFEGMIELAVYGQFMASLDKRKAYRRKVYIATITGIVVILADIVFLHGFWKLATAAFTIQNIIQAVLVFSYYYNLLHNMNDYPDLITHPPFLAATGLLVYSVVNCFYFTTFDFVVYQKRYPFPMTVITIHEISITFLYTLLGVSFLCFLRPKKLA